MYVRVKSRYKDTGGVSNENNIEGECPPGAARGNTRWETLLGRMYMIVYQMLGMALIFGN